MTRAETFRVNLQMLCRVHSIPSFTDEEANEIAAVMRTAIRLGTARPRTGFDRVVFSMVLDIWWDMIFPLDVESFQQEFQRALAHTTEVSV